MEKRFDMNSAIIPTLFDLVEEEALPIEIIVGESYKDGNGDTMKSILLSFNENKLKEDIESIIDKAVNVTFGLVEE